LTQLNPCNGSGWWLVAGPTGHRWWSFITSH
jgi:hypothetical protein